MKGFCVLWRVLQFAVSIFRATWALGQRRLSEQVGVFSCLVPLVSASAVGGLLGANGRSCFDPHCLSQLCGWSALPGATSPSLPLRQDHVLPVKVHPHSTASVSPGFPACVSSPAFLSPIIPAIPSLAASLPFWPRGSPGRGKRQELGDPEPSAARAVGWRRMLWACKSRCAQWLYHVYLQLCQGTSYSVCCIKWCVVGKQTEHH